MSATDYERMRERHHNGMCGGDCPECYVQQREEAYREQERQAAYEWAREEQEREERRISGAANDQDQHSTEQK